MKRKDYQEMGEPKKQTRYFQVKIPEEPDCVYRIRTPPPIKQEVFTFKEQIFHQLFELQDRNNYLKDYIRLVASAFEKDYDPDAVIIMEIQFYRPEFTLTQDLTLYYKSIVKFDKDGKEITGKYMTDNAVFRAMVGIISYELQNSFLIDNSNKCILSKARMCRLLESYQSLFRHYHEILWFHSNEKPVKEEKKNNNNN